jgi:hypothetical protein
MHIISKQGQWLGDVAVREAGSIEAVVEMAIRNNISITGALPAGTKLLKPTPVNRRVMNYYSLNGIFPATATPVAGPQLGMMVFTEDDVFTVPDDVYQVEVFAVGGGGAGKQSISVNRSGSNGGNGGQVIYETVTVNPGQVVPVIIGAGGMKEFGNSPYIPGQQGGNTSFGDLVTALGGMGGATPTSEYSINTFVPQPDVEYSAQGGYNEVNPVDRREGRDGTPCPFDLSDFPELNGKLFGPGGGFGINQIYFYKGGESDGGRGACRGNAGASGAFYGAGGGGGSSAGGGSGAYVVDNPLQPAMPGSGYQGILIIRYESAP